MSERKAKTEVIVVVNGSYGRDLVETAEVLVGPLDVRVMETPCSEQSVATRRQIRQTLGGWVGQASNVLFIADLAGSSPANACLDLLQGYPGRQMVTGLNLAMMLKLATSGRDTSAADLANGLANTGQRAVNARWQPDAKEDRRGD